MTKQEAIKKFNKETKQQATIKVRTLIIAVLWLVTIVGALIAGWTFRSNFANEVRSEVKSQMVVVEPVKKQQ